MGGGASKKADAKDANDKKDKKDKSIKHNLNLTLL